MHSRKWGNAGGLHDGGRGATAGVDVRGGACVAVTLAAAHAVPAARFRQLHGPSRPEIPRPARRRVDRDVALAGAQMEPQGAQVSQAPDDGGTPNRRAGWRHPTETAGCGFAPQILIQQQQRGTAQPAVSAERGLDESWQALAEVAELRYERGSSNAIECEEPGVRGCSAAASCFCCHLRACAKSCRTRSARRRA